MGAGGRGSKDIMRANYESRTHIDTKDRVCGHKIMLQKDNICQTKNIRYSETKDAVRLIAKVNTLDNTISIQDINVIKDHHLSFEINLKFDANGNVLPYNPKKPGSGSHGHEWIKDSKGNVVRKLIGGPESHLPIPQEYQSLISKIARYNKTRKQYNGTN